MTDPTDDDRYGGMLYDETLDENGEPVIGSDVVDVNGERPIEPTCRGDGLAATAT